MFKKNFAAKLKEIFGAASPGSDEFFDELGDILIEGDLGPKTAFETVERLKSQCKKKRVFDQSGITQELKSILGEYLYSASFDPENGKTSIYLLLGVNGAGKTTTAAKMAAYYLARGVSPIALAAADTFRAAAIDQLRLHGERLGVRVVAHQYGADPGAVVYDAAEAVAAKGGGLVIADTAGRLHTKENLLNELRKIDRIAASKASPGCYKKFIALDVTTGLNALRQAEVFNEAVGIDAVILTKYDSSAKGGAACAVGKELRLPVAFVCDGERYENLRVFDRGAYLDEFIGL